MDCVVTPLKTLMGFSVHLNVQLKFYNLPIVLTIHNCHKTFLYQRFTSVLSINIIIKILSEIFTNQTNSVVFTSRYCKIG
ncbi:hypothetical protein AOZ08_014605 [Lactiplantibacillus plantarum]|nr:hypothetical protein AOZ08_014605 [Lactiplantibacillus plantarum]